jgi:hypothetical protein
MKDFTELASALLAGIIMLTFTLIVVQNYQGAGGILQQGASATKTFVSAFASPSAAVQ